MVEAARMSLNLIVAAIAFYHYQRAGHHIPRMTSIFIVASIPMAFVGGCCWLMVLCTM